MVHEEVEGLYFLPRILELFVVERKHGFSKNILIDKLSAANCSKWPTQEREALIAFFRKMQSPAPLKKLANAALELLC
jgi:hypothetical protein